MCGGAVGDFFDSVGDAVGDAVGDLGDLVNDVIDSDLGKVALVGAGLYFGLPALSELGAETLGAEALGADVLGADALAGLDAATLAEGWGGAGALGVGGAEGLAGLELGGLAGLPELADLGEFAGLDEAIASQADAAATAAEGWGGAGGVGVGGEEGLAGLDLTGAGAAGVTGPGYYDEITGEFISDPNGGLQGPLDEAVSGNPDTMKDWTVDPETGVWTNGATGEVFESTPWDPNAPAVTGKDIMESAGALPGGSISPSTVSKIAKSLLGGAGAGAGAGALLGLGGMGSKTGSGTNSGSAVQSTPTSASANVMPKFTNTDMITVPISTIAQLMGPQGMKQGIKA